MISPSVLAEIRRLHEVEGWSIGTIARQLGVHHGTVPGNRCQPNPRTNRSSCGERGQDYRSRPKTAAGSASCSRSSAEIMPNSEPVRPSESRTEESGRGTAATRTGGRNDLKVFGLGAGPA